ncbi:CPBP family intramembrane glutamic endopeptidase [Microbacterium rhizomatis]|uniref:CPBP family intramembrane metalloprotease n=1 Tax=Microbacterium rhizomatis TaxID=1631477 RepID=A0A5J5J6Z5_9MICO|nr:CPBP family intramembrane glutamic endopeptidase [Microbacterium rhizomatis]KAA9110638.1 CPBP family intramembrane metalloprotease [Microbacterium rhizomatis]
MGESETPTAVTGRTPTGAMTAVAVFLLVEILIATPLYVLLSLRIADPMLLVVAVMVSPAAAALLTWAITGVRPRVGPLRVWPILAGASIGFVVAFAYWIGSLAHVFTPTGIDPWITLVGLPVSVVLAAGEELGWRGMLLPQLRRRFRFASANAIVVVIWALFHVPIVVAGAYGDLAGLPWMFLIVVLFSFLIGTIWEYGGGVVMASLAHGVWNLVIQSFLATAFVENIPYAAGEFGWFPAIPLALMLAGALVLRTLRPPRRPPLDDLA